VEILVVKGDAFLLVNCDYMYVSFSTWY